MLPDTSRLATFQTLRPDDIVAFDTLTGPERRLQRGDVLRLEGSVSPDLYRLHAGWLACSVGLPDGGRQITKVHLPGDLVGMPSMGSPEAIETIWALTDATVTIVSLETFGRAIREHPRFGGLLFLWSQEERAALMAQLTLIGRLPGARRMAAFLLSLYLRAALSDGAIGDTLMLPMTQQDLGDATGMSAVHANRCLGELRRRGLLTWKKDLVLIHDLPALKRFAPLPEARPRRTDWL